MLTRRLAVLAGSLILTCATTLAQNAPAAPVPAATAPAASAGAGVDSTYLIGPQDTVRIMVYMQPELSGPVVVQTDGMIALPLIPNPIKAEGLTQIQLRDKLVELWKENVKSPDVTVSVTDVRSKSYRVTGMVLKPGTVPITRPTRVSEAIADAGFQPYANKKDIHIMRGGGKQILHFSWNDFRQGKNLDKDILLENGDIVEVR